ncbi:MAG: hypothetical protein A2Y62_11660 [Candidatus Fischerbacteria bacterium RBG_13_37_8]|uniref:EamA domain-containing protein n=1 Tax=Candidatus Fischerbacteria bacterium RBG_13_37_8 TaxID=1817863 RepID=A0A1F5VGN6_9BACT|nr:MAG: hypothetical protein A2Y62_11660 [Candidatus Fischerbacteria bacterium RBG_13_37_8]
MEQFYGHIAAVMTAMCWSFNSVVFSQAGKKVGSHTVNHIRLWIAFITLIIIHGILYGSILPFSAEGYRWLWLSISGIIGFSIGDGLLFEALVLIGPRRSTLLMLLAPIFSALLGWVVLGENLSLNQIIAIFVTVGGISWVVSEITKNTGIQNKDYLHGILFGIGGAVCQATGLLFSKMGLEGGFSPISANLIRLTAATLTTCLIAVFAGKFLSDFTKMKNKRAFAETASGAFAGPVIGVILSLVAISRIHIGIASTLMQLAPIFLLPVAHFLFKEKITARAIAGTIIALGGASLLFFL